jgi:Holliday junction resolvase RusA-like endonuclease
MKLKFKQNFSVRPKAKGRPQFNRKTGNVYTPKTTREYENQIKSMYTGPLFKEELLSVKIKFSIDGTEIKNKEKSKLTADIDNYAKAFLDALNGVAYTDDKQIVSLYLEKA